jgi:hypothetical protein
MQKENFTFHFQQYLGTIQGQYCEKTEWEVKYMPRMNSSQILVSGHLSNFFSLRVRRIRKTVKNEGKRSPSQ